MKRKHGTDGFTKVEYTCLPAVCYHFFFFFLAFDLARRSVATAISSALCRFGCNTTLALLLETDLTDEPLCGATMPLLVFCCLLSCQISRIGEATKIEEYVPTRIPTPRLSAKTWIVPVAKTRIAVTASRVVNEVIKVRLRD